MIIRENKKIELTENKETLEIIYNKNNICLKSNDINGITIYPDNIVWQNFDNLFNNLSMINSENIKKYSDYLISITNDFSRFSIVRNDDIYIVSVISPIERKIKIPANTEIGLIFLKFYSDLITLDKNIEQLTIPGYMYSLKRKSVKYNKGV